MTKTSKSERKYGANIDKKPPKKSNKQKDVEAKPTIEYYKVLIDGASFSKTMSYDECIKLVDSMEASAKKLRRPLPSLILVKQ